MSTCRVCDQPMENCFRSKRRDADSFSIIIRHQPHFQDVVAVPCHFKAKLDYFADKWLPAESSSHRFELFLEKNDQTTFIRGPYWNSYCRSHNIAINDVVTFTLIGPQPGAQVRAEQDEDEEGSGEGSQEDMEEEDIKVEEVSEEEGADQEEGAEEEGSEEEELVSRGQHVFHMTARAPNGDLKEFNYIIPGGLALLDVDPNIREVFYRSVFHDMYAITTADMSAITFEMMKEVNKQRRAPEDEFYHLSELQYYVTLLHAIYQANNIFVMPSSFAHGYKIPRQDRALFMTYGMDEPVQGNYIIRHGNLNEIEFINGWTHFCNMNELQGGSLVAVRMEMREKCIGLFVAKIR